MEPSVHNSPFGVGRLLKLSPFSTWILFIIVLTCVDYIDYITGPNLDVCFLLTLPTLLVSWRFGVRYGLLTSVLCSVSAMFADYGNPLFYSHPSIAWLNAITLTMYLAVFAFTIHKLHIEMELRQKYARTDPLTGLLNRRAFDEAMQHEMNRLTRFKRPFTLLVLDLDKFKQVNDTQGHAAGDRYLVSWRVHFGTPTLWRDWGAMNSRFS